MVFVHKQDTFPHMQQHFPFPQDALQICSEGLEDSLEQIWGLQGVGQARKWTFCCPSGSWLLSHWMQPLKPYLEWIGLQLEDPILKNKAHGHLAAGDMKRPEDSLQTLSN